MLCVILSHPYLHRRKVEEVESGRDSEVATGLLSTSPFEQTDRSRPRTSWPARPWGYGPRGQGHVLAAQRSWTYTLMLNAAACCSFFCPWTVEGTMVTHVNQLSKVADRAAVDINLALTSVTSATITFALQLKPLQNILISKEVQH